MKRSLFVFLFIINCVLVFSQEKNELWKEFFKVGIDNASNVIGKDKSALPNTLERINIKNDPQHDYKLTRVVVDQGGIWNSLAFQKIKITENFFITNKSIINKWELEVYVNNVENELDMMLAVKELMDAYAKQIEAPRVQEHWYGPPSVSGRFIWLWNSKNLIVTMSPSEGFWVWEQSIMYITITRQL
jgi:hypothetical protein